MNQKIYELAKKFAPVGWSDEAIQGFAEAMHKHLFQNRNARR